MNDCFTEQLLTFLWGLLTPCSLMSDVNVAACTKNTQAYGCRISHHHNKVIHRYFGIYSLLKKVETE